MPSSLLHRFQVWLTPDGPSWQPITSPPYFMIEAYPHGNAIELDRALVTLNLDGYLMEFDLTGSQLHMLTSRLRGRGNLIQRILENFRQLSPELQAQILALGPSEGELEERILLAFLSQVLFFLAIATLLERLLEHLPHRQHCEPDRRIDVSLLSPEMLEWYLTYLNILWQLLTLLEQQSSLKSTEMMKSTEMNLMHRKLFPRFKSLLAPRSQYFQGSYQLPREMDGFLKQAIKFIVLFGEFFQPGTSPNTNQLMTLITGESVVTGLMTHGLINFNQVIHDAVETVTEAGTVQIERLRNQLPELQKQVVENSVNELKLELDDYLKTQAGAQVRAAVNNSISQIDTMVKDEVEKIIEGEIPAAKAQLQAAVSEEVEKVQESVTQAQEIANSLMDLKNEIPQLVSEVGDLEGRTAKLERKVFGNGSNLTPAGPVAPTNSMVGSSLIPIGLDGSNRRPAGLVAPTNSNSTQPQSCRSVSFTLPTSKSQTNNSRVGKEAKHAMNSTELSSQAIAQRLSENLSTFLDDWSKGEINLCQYYDQLKTLDSSLTSFREKYPTAASRLPAVTYPSDCVLELTKLKLQSQGDLSFPPCRSDDDEMTLAKKALQTHLMGSKVISRMIDTGTINTADLNNLIGGSNLVIGCVNAKTGSKIPTLNKPGIKTPVKLIETQCAEAKKLCPEVKNQVKIKTPRPLLELVTEDTPTPDEISQTVVAEVRQTLAKIAEDWTQGKFDYPAYQDQLSKLGLSIYAIRSVDPKFQQLANLKTPPKPRSQLIPQETRGGVRLPPMPNLRQNAPQITSEVIRMANQGFSEIINPMLASGQVNVNQLQGLYKEVGNWINAINEKYGTQISQLPTMAALKHIFSQPVKVTGTESHASDSIVRLNQAGRVETGKMEMKSNGMNEMGDDKWDPHSVVRKQNGMNGMNGYQMNSNQGQERAQDLMDLNHKLRQSLRAMQFRI